ncbi:MAG: DUF1385 domain-containing protein [Armatimonadota bacterium]|jgi:uncharacterized protein YqhQ
MQPTAPDNGPPRISGSAMPGGVFMSTGTARSHEGLTGELSLVSTGLSIATLGALGMVLTYIISWTLQQVYGIPLAHALLMIQTTVDPGTGPWVDVGLNLLLLLSFLTLMRISPLSGYHAAEHKVIAAIEHFGEPTMEHARMMPRAHRRCGSNLLAGLLPLLLLGEPLYRVSPILAVIVVVLGWQFRFVLGYFIQAIFATKEPTERQLAAALGSGERVLQRSRETAGLRLPALVSFWRRGMLQMFGGMLLGLWLLTRIFSHLHVWLDF